jgi:hypothetical protein
LEKVAVKARATVSNNDHHVRPEAVGRCDNSVRMGMRKAIQSDHPPKLRAKIKEERSKERERSGLQGFLDLTRVY